MSDPAQTSFYGLKSVSMAELLSLVDIGNEQARDELKDRLSGCLAKLLDLYETAYQQDQARSIETLKADLECLKA